MISSSKVIPIVRGKNPIRGICRKSPIYRRYKTNSLYPYSTDSYNYFPKIIKDEMLGLAFCDAFNDYKKAFPEESNNEAGMFADDRVYGRHMIYGINPL